MEHEHKKPKRSVKYTSLEIYLHGKCSQIALSGQLIVPKWFGLGATGLGWGRAMLIHGINDMKLARLGAARTGKASLGWVELAWNMLIKGVSAH